MERTGTFRTLESDPHASKAGQIQTCRVKGPERIWNVPEFSRPTRSLHPDAGLRGAGTNDNYRPGADLLSGGVAPAEDKMLHQMIACVRLRAASGVICNQRLALMKKLCLLCVFISCFMSTAVLRVSRAAHK